MKLCFVVRFGAGLVVEGRAVFKIWVSPNDLKPARYGKEKAHHHRVYDITAYTRLSITRVLCQVVALVSRAGPLRQPQPFFCLGGGVCLVGIRVA